MQRKSSYDELQSWTGHPAAVIKCSVPDVYQASTIRRNQLYAEPIFMLDQCPFRNVEFVGWVSTLSYVAVERDAEDPTIRMMLTIDDGNGEYIISVTKVLNNDLVDRPRRGGAGPISPETPYQSGQKYMTITERKEWELQQKKGKVKRHNYPNINIGDIARIRGKLKEWSRRNGEVIREVVEKVRASSWEEYRHLQDVERLKRDVYSIPFDSKVYESMLAPATPIFSQFPQTQLSTPGQSLTWPATATLSQVTGYDPSCDSIAPTGSASQAPSTLRHPCKLSRDHLNDNQFRRYLMEYLRIQTENHWCTDLESAQAITEAARYMPELTWPTPEIAAAQMVRAQQKRRQAQILLLDDDLQDFDSTPKAGGMKKTMLQHSTKRRSPLTPVKFNGTRVGTFDFSAGIQLEEASNCAFGLEHVVHVPHLRVFAHRFVRQEQAKENELYMTRRKALKAATAAQSGSVDASKAKKPGFGMVYKDSRARRAERGRKMRKLIQHCFRLMVATDGSVIEVSMSEQDKEAIRVDEAVRKMTKNGSQSYEASYTSKGSLMGVISIANTTFGNASQLSIANSSFDYSIWEAPTNFKDHPSDSDSSSEQTPEESKPLRFKDDPTGYLPLTLPVLGMAILHILHEEVFQRSRVYIPASDRRHSNGLRADEIWARLRRLHERWERCQLAVIEDGVEDLEEVRYVKRWGEGWWPVQSRLEPGGR
ncbi:hypothetical protein QFC21_003113 [Naganishia friedmannii]|uniref:Uncharacterized protein n=1 Tax=Naganishia friedmannii TaxID=89922 RepID=A0ACC2VRZ1_9TREE|nr:hypothetical protein QFC21_003113 [Naganishia friedmannii]